MFFYILLIFFILKGLKSQRTPRLSFFLLPFSSVQHIVTMSISPGSSKGRHTEDALKEDVEQLAGPSSVRKSGKQPQKNQRSKHRVAHTRGNQESRNLGPELQHSDRSALTHSTIYVATEPTTQASTQNSEINVSYLSNNQIRQLAVRL